MLPTLRLILLFGTLVGWLLAAGAALAAPLGVKDGARLFKPETIKKADEQIERIQRRFFFDMVIETFPQLTNGQVEALKKLKDAASRDRFFRELAEKQAQEAGARGIYVWICKSPSQVEVVAGPDVTEEMFPVKYRKELRDQLARRIGSDRRRDEELLGALKNVHDRLEAAGRPVIWPWVLGLVAAVLGVWVVIALLLHRHKEAPASEAVGQAGANPGPSDFPDPKSEMTNADEPQPSDYHASSDGRLE